MRNFTYQALTENEELRTGEISAKSAATALEQLEAQGLRVLLIREVNGVVTAPAGTEDRAHEAQATIGESLLSERVAHLLAKRKSLAPALQAFAEELPRSRARRDLFSLADRIQQGASVEELTTRPLVMDLWLPIIGGSSGLGTGYLQDALHEAERTFANRTRIARSVAYPVAVFLMALAVLVLLGVVVVPAFREIYDDFGMSLPGITRLVLGFSGLLLHRPLELLVSVLLILAIAYSIFFVLRHWLLPSRWFGTLLDGSSQQVSEMAVFVRRLAEALNAGLAPSDALLLVGESSKHGWINREAQRLAHGLRAGIPGQQILAGSVLPATVVHALGAGPEGTPHVSLLQAIADGYFERVSNRFTWAVGFWPQLAILCVGVVVLIVVLSLYLPLVTLINGLI